MSSSTGLSRNRAEAFKAEPCPGLFQRTLSNEFWEDHQRSNSTSPYGKPARHSWLGQPSQRSQTAFGSVKQSYDSSYDSAGNLNRRRQSCPLRKLPSQRNKRNLRRNTAANLDDDPKFPAPAVLRWLPVQSKQVANYSGIRDKVEASNSSQYDLLCQKFTPAMLWAKKCGWSQEKCVEIGLEIDEAIDGAEDRMSDAWSLRAKEAKEHAGRCLEMSNKASENFAIAYIHVVNAEESQRLLAAGRSSAEQMVDLKETSRGLRFKFKEAMQYMQEEGWPLTRCVAVGQQIAQQVAAKFRKDQSHKTSSKWSFMPSSPDAALRVTALQQALAAVDVMKHKQSLAELAKRAQIEQAEREGVKLPTVASAPLPKHYGATLAQ